MRYKFSKQFLGLAALMILLVVLPFVVNLYYVDVLTVLLINAILVASFRFIALTGEFSFAHVGLMAVGALSTAMITTRLGWSFWLSLPLAGLSSALVALALSYPLLRMKGFSFFIGSFAAGEIIRLSWMRFKIFGAHAGIEGIPLPSLPGINFHNFIVYYFLTLVVTSLCLVVMYQLENSRIGNTVKAVAANDSLAQSIGINIRRYRTFAFVTGSFFAGIAGVLLAHRLGAVDSHQFVFSYNLFVIVWTLFGGLGSFPGPLIGLVLFSGLDEVIHSIGQLERWTPFMYGGILIVTLLVMPQGVIGLPQRISPLLQRLHMSWIGRKRGVT